MSDADDDEVTGPDIWRIRGHRKVGSYDRDCRKRGDLRAIWSRDRRKVRPVDGYGGGWREEK